MSEWEQAATRLRQLVQLGDPDGTVTLRWLAELLGEPVEGDAVAQSDPPRDLTVVEVSERFRRAPSTIRGWLSRGELQGYKLNGRDWRVTRAAAMEYEQRQREPRVEDLDDADISAWRRI
jgi:excisionase family DNA binding protein